MFCRFQLAGKRWRPICIGHGANPSVLAVARDVFDATSSPRDPTDERVQDGVLPACDAGRPSATLFPISWVQIIRRTKRCELLRTNTASKPTASLPKHQACEQDCDEANGAGPDGPGIQELTDRKSCSARSDSFPRLAPSLTRPPLHGIRYAFEGDRPPIAFGPVSRDVEIRSPPIRSRHPGFLLPTMALSTPSPVYPSPEVLSQR